MNAILKSRNFALFSYACMAVVLWLTWTLVDYVNENLNSVAVERVKTVQEVSVPFDVHNLYPVEVRAAKRGPVTPVGDDIDRAFRKDPPPMAPEPVEPPEPDYSALLQQYMLVDGIGTNGVFIHGKFYSVGEAVPEYSYPMRGRTIVPVVASVSGNTVVIKHGAKTAVFRL